MYNNLQTAQILELCSDNYKRATTNTLVVLPQSRLMQWMTCYQRKHWNIANKLVVQCINKCRHHKWWWVIIIGIYLGYVGFWQSGGFSFSLHSISGPNISGGSRIDWVGLPGGLEGMDPQAGGGYWYNGPKKSLFEGSLYKFFY